jgi:hypothetical protein
MPKSENPKFHNNATGYVHCIDCPFIDGNRKQTAHSMDWNAYDCPTLETYSDACKYAEEHPIETVAV